MVTDHAITSINSAPSHLQFQVHNQAIKQFQVHNQEIKQSK
jgi:hypothetical protein